MKGKERKENNSNKKKKHGCHCLVSAYVSY